MAIQRDGNQYNNYFHVTIKLLNEFCRARTFNIKFKLFQFVTAA